MLVRRSILAIARQSRSRSPAVCRTFSSSVSRKDDARSKDGIITSKEPIDLSKLKTISEIKQDSDLLPPGAPVGTIPTELNQSTGLERLEILGKMQGIDIFDMRPLDTSRKGTVDSPIIITSQGEEQYIGCTGVPASTHETTWLTISRDRPIERCTACGNVIKMDYIGVEDPHHGHPPHKHEPESFADYIKPEYTYR